MWCWVMAVARSAVGESPGWEMSLAVQRVKSHGRRKGVCEKSGVAVGVSGKCAGRVARELRERLSGGVVSAR